jgi:hypothetical protein
MSECKVIQADLDQTVAKLLGQGFSPILVSLELLLFGDKSNDQVDRSGQCSSTLASFKRRIGKKRLPRRKKTTGTLH